MKNIGILLCILAMVACSKSEIDTWSAKPRVWFTSEDTTLFLFNMLPPETTEHVVEIPITMAGQMTHHDRKVNVEDLGARNPATRYEIIDAFIRADSTGGFLQVKVHKTENLNSGSDTLNFKICVSDLFEVGLEERSVATLIVTNAWDQPLWWDADADEFIGYYSDKKLEIIYTVLGSDEVFKNATRWNAEEVSLAIYKLNRYCKINNVKYNETDEDVIKFDAYSI